MPVITLHREAVPCASLLLKRLLDIAGAAASLALAGPLMAIVALLIRLESPGRIIYAAERIGAKGRVFRCYKFRSMVTNADHLKQDLRDQAKPAAWTDVQDCGRSPHYPRRKLCLFDGTAWMNYHSYGTCCAAI